MPLAPLPLKNLARQLAQKQAELEKARRAYETRLTNLTRRKAELQAQLDAVDAEIQGVQGTPAPSTPSAATAPPPPQPLATRGQSEGGLGLGQLIVDLVRAAGRPITAKELGEQVLQAKFQTASGNIPHMVKNKVSELIGKGVLRRPKGESGVVLAKASVQPAAKGSKTGKAAPAPKAASQAAQAAAKPAAPAAPAGKRGTESLRDVLIRILTEATRPLKARELADQVLATGYETKSKDFVNVIWVALGKMQDVLENVPGEGYRLMKSAAEPK